MDAYPAGDEDLRLTAEEHEGVRAAVRTGAERRAGGSECTLNSLVAAWAALIREVEEGYSWCEPEFAHDIWCRNALGRVWPLLPARVQAMRQAELDGLDARFGAATVAWPGEDRRAEQWWQLRIPRRIEIEPGEGLSNGWPWGWETMPFPKPDDIEIAE